MWSAKKGMHKKEVGIVSPDYPYGGGYATLYFNDKKVCNFEEWVHHCCGLAGLSYFGAYDSAPVLNVPENVDSLLKFLEENDGLWHHPKFKAREYMFTLSSGQLILYKEFINHPNVRLIDRWKNKSHEPNDILLFRLSAQQDFKKCPSM